MRTYEVTYNGMTHRVQLSDTDAERLGASAVDDEGSEPEPKARSTSNKSRTPKNKSGDEA